MTHFIQHVVGVVGIGLVAATIPDVGAYMFTDTQQRLAADKCILFTGGWMCIALGFFAS